MLKRLIAAISTAFHAELWPVWSKYSADVQTLQITLLLTFLAAQMSAELDGIRGLEVLPRT